jgi:dihydroorotate dehydrogenase
LSPSLYNSVVRRAIFLSSPETAHSIAKWFFKHPTLWKPASKFLSVKDDRLKVKLDQLELTNPIGLAAGFDKNCEMWKSLYLMGFGYLTLGTVTLNARNGNPRPRIWRHPQDQSLTNSMGLPNDGARKISTNLLREHSELSQLIVSVSGLTTDEFAECYQVIEPLANGVELNISTPNTVGVRMFQEPDTLETLLIAINKTKSPGKLLWVKLPPYFNDKEREKIQNLVGVCIRNSVNGLTLINTKMIDEPRASIGTGGLSGPPIFNDMIRIVSDIYKETGAKIPINACGGISSGLDAWKALEAGASTVQVYTAFIYQGPGLVSKINRQLLDLLENSRMKSLSEVTGTGVS